MEWLTEHGPGGCDNDALRTQQKTLYHTTHTVQNNIKGERAHWAADTPPLCPMRASRALAGASAVQRSAEARPTHPPRW